MLVHTPGPTGVEVGREGWQVGCDDLPITRPFKPLQDDPTNRDYGLQRQDRRPLSDCIIWLNHETAAAQGGGVGGKGLTRSMITAARAFGVSSGAAPSPPSDYGSMAPPRSFCVFSFLAYIISSFVFHVYAAHRFPSLSLSSLTTILP